MNIPICPGGACPLRMTCRRFQDWLNNEEDDPDIEMEPDYHNGGCLLYVQKQFYDR